MIRAVALIFLFFATGCGLRLEPAGTDAIAPGYVTGGGEWDSGGGVTAVARVFGRGGRTIVCGAWMTDRQSVLSILYNEDVVAAASIFAGDTRMTGQQANCVFSNLPWTEQLSGAPVRMRFPRLSFGGDFGAGLGIGFGGVGIGSGDRVTFRERPRPDPVR
jgi:hypothetical protein